MTDSLANPLNQPIIPPIVTDSFSMNSSDNIDDKMNQSVLSENTTNTSLLYRFGQEVNVSKSMPPQPHNVLNYSNPSPTTINTSTKYNRSIRSSFSDRNDLLTLESTVGEITTIEDPTAAATYLQFLVNMDKSKSIKTNKLVSGSQFRMINNNYSHKCDQCEILDKQNKKSKEIIRTLKLQIARYEEKLHEMKLKNNNISDSRSYSTDQNEHILNHYSIEYDKIIKKCEAQEEEISRLKKLISSSTPSHSSTARMNAALLDETNNKLKNEIIELKNEIQRLEDIIKKNANEKKENDRTINNLNASLTSYKAQLEKSEGRINELTIRLNTPVQSQSELETLKELTKLKADFANIDALYRNANATLRNKSIQLNQAEEKIEGLNKALHNLQMINNGLEQDLSKSNIDLRNANEQLLFGKKRLDLLDGSLKDTILERDKFSEQANSIQSELTLSQTKCKSLEAEVSSLNSRLSDLMRRMAVDSDTTKRALEKAITSSIRLCVVAPTVNVHVADKKLKFKA
eukprot:gene11813-15810_t